MAAETGDNACVPGGDHSRAYARDPGLGARPPC